MALRFRLMAARYAGFRASRAALPVCGVHGLTRRDAWFGIAAIMAAWDCDCLLYTSDAADE